MLQLWRLASKNSRHEKSLDLRFCAQHASSPVRRRLRSDDISCQDTNIMGLPTSISGAIQYLTDYSRNTSVVGSCGFFLLPLRHMSSFVRSLTCK